MATRSTIAIQRQDGTVAQVYCHWDGYLENNGDILVKFYDTADKVEALLAHGDISSLGQEVGVQHPFSTYEMPKASRISNEQYEELYGTMTTYYGRDRGETDTAARVYVDIEFYEKTAQFEEFNYLFIEGEWYYKSYDGMVRDVKTQLAQLRLKEPVLA